MKRPARLTLMDRDKVSALLSRCTELRERAEKAEARIETAQTLDYGQFHSIRDYRDAVLAVLAAEEKPK